MGIEVGSRVSTHNFHRKKKKKENAGSRKSALPERVFFLCSGSLWLCLDIRCPQIYANVAAVIVANNDFKVELLLKCLVL